MDIDSVYQQIYETINKVNKMQDNVNKSLTDLDAFREVLYTHHGNIADTSHDIIELAKQILSKGSHLCSEGNQTLGLKYMRSADMIAEQSRRCQLFLQQIDKILDKINEIDAQK